MDESNRFQQTCDKSYLRPDMTQALGAAIKEAGAGMLNTSLMVSRGR